MTTYAFPTLVRSAPGTVEWWLVSNTQIFQSPLDNSIQRLEIPGARWYCRAEYQNLDPVDWRVLNAFFASLRGQANSFTWHDHSRPTPRGTIAGTPLVNGAGQSGATLNIDGVTNGTTLLKGDLIGVNGELREIIADVTAAAGAMALTLDAPLRAAPADNAAVTTTRPTATLILMNPETPRRAVRPGLFSSMTVEAMEVW